jgi:hypothetical protein
MNNKTSGAQKFSDLRRYNGRRHCKDLEERYTNDTKKVEDGFNANF